MQRPTVSYDPEIEIDDVVQVQVGPISFWTICTSELGHAVNARIAFEVREGLASGMWLVDRRPEDWGPNVSSIYERFRKKNQCAAIVTVETFWKIWHELTDPYLFPKKKGRISVEVPLGPDTPPEIVADWLQDKGLEKIAQGVRVWRDGEDHKGRHEMLHRHLDELVADYINHSHRLPSDTSVIELMQWSYTQTQNPTELK